MKKRITSLLMLMFLLLIAMSFSACTDDDHNANEKFEISDCVFSSFTAEDYDGDIIDETMLADYKITMINVWGTFCAPCKKEAPELAELNKEYADKGLQVIGIPVDSSRNSAADAREVIDEVHADFRHLKVSASIKSFVLATEHLPYTIFINADGKQIGEAYSGAKSKEEWTQIINEILEFIDL